MPTDKQLTVTDKIIEAITGHLPDDVIWTYKGVPIEQVKEIVRKSCAVQQSYANQALERVYVCDMEFTEDEPVEDPSQDIYRDEDDVTPAPEQSEPSSSPQNP